MKDSRVFARSGELARLMPLRSIGDRPAPRTLVLTLLIAGLLAGCGGGGSSTRGARVSATSKGPVSLAAISSNGLGPACISALGYPQTVAADFNAPQFATSQAQSGGSGGLVCDYYFSQSDLQFGDPALAINIACCRSTPFDNNAGGFQLVNRAGVTLGAYSPSGNVLVSAGRPAMQIVLDHLTK